MKTEELKKIKEIAEKVDERNSANIWEKYDNQNIYVEVGRTDKKITIHCRKKEIYANRPGAYTEANVIAAALNESGFNFTVKF